MNDQQTMAPDRFVGLAFPVIRVKYSGPTNTRGGRWIATLRGVRITVPFDHSVSESKGPYLAAVKCWEKYRAQHSEGFDNDTHVFVPGDLDNSTYAYTVVPAGYLENE